MTDEILILQSRLEETQRRLLAAEARAGELEHLALGFMAGASTQPHMGGDVTIFGWDHRKLTKAYNEAREVLARNGGAK